MKNGSSSQLIKLRPPYNTFVQKSFRAAQYSMTVRQTTLGGASGRGSKNNKRKEPKKSTTKTGKRASSLMKAKAEKAADGADIGTAEGSPVKVVPRHTPPAGLRARRNPGRRCKSSSEVDEHDDEGALIPDDEHDETNDAEEEEDGDVQSVSDHGSADESEADALENDDDDVTFEELKIGSLQPSTSQRATPSPPQQNKDGPEQDGSAKAAEKPSTPTPPTSKPAMPKPATTTSPGTLKPGKSRPATPKKTKPTPGTSTPTTLKPTMSIPELSKPVTSESVTPKSATPTPARPKSATHKSATPKNATPKNAMLNTATPKSASLKSATPKSATSKSVTLKSATPKSITPRSATPKHATPKPARSKPATSKPATPKHATTRSATPQPATPKSATSKPTTAIVGGTKRRREPPQESGAAGLNTDDDDFVDTSKAAKRRRTLRQLHEDTIREGQAVRKAANAARKKSKARTSSTSNTAGGGVIHRDGCDSSDGEEGNPCENVHVKKECSPEDNMDIKPVVKTEGERKVQMGKIQPKQAYLYIMQEYVTDLDVAFSEADLARCTAIAVLRYLTVASKQSYYSIELVSECVRALVFNRKGSITLEQAWSSVDGKLASLLRRRVMKCSLVMAQRNLFDNFRNHESEDRSPMPLWLTKKVRNADGNLMEYLSAAHIKKTVDMEETLTDPREEFKRRKNVARRAEPKPLDVGLYVFRAMYTSLRKMYGATRQAARLRFFNRVGYFFMDWCEFPECEVSDGKVSMRWVAPVGAPITEMAAQGMFPTCDTYAMQTMRRRRKAVEDREKMEARKNGMKWKKSGKNEDVIDNIVEYTKFARSALDVTLIVEHDIILRKDVSRHVKRRRKGNTRLKWRKAINLMDEMRDLLEGLCGFKPKHEPYDFLRADENSIQIVYNCARTMRVILSRQETRDIYEPTESPDLGDYDVDVDDACNGGAHGDDADDDDDAGIGEAQADDAHENDDNGEGDGCTDVADAGNDNEVGDDDEDGDGVDGDVAHGGAAQGVDQSGGLGDRSGSKVNDRDGHREGVHAVPHAGVGCTGEQASSSAADAHDKHAHAGSEDDVDGSKEVTEGRESCPGGEYGADAGATDENEQREGGSGTGCVSGDDDDDNGYPKYDIDGVEYAVAALFNALVGPDIATGHNLSQTTCTVPEELYLSERISLENDETKLFGNLTMDGSGPALSDEDDEEENKIPMSYDSDVEFDDFGMNLE